MTGTTAFRELAFSSYRTGALDLSFASRRVLSLPTQLGCPVGCTFCVSRDTPVIRNLRHDELLQLLATCLAAAQPDGRPIELSFTGEGEAVVNWREVAKTCRAAPALCPDIRSARFCCSGFGLPRLLERLDSGGLPARLQFSLHAARQGVRDRLVPRSAPLVDVEAALRANASRFQSIELNVVLQDGVNDSDEDLAALIAFGDPVWPVLLNPLLRDGRELVAERTAAFESALRAAGRDVRRYAQVAASISRVGIYPRMTARRD